MASGALEKAIVAYAGEVERHRAALELLCAAARFRRATTRRSLLARLGAGAECQTSNATCPEFLQLTS